MKSRHIYRIAVVILMVAFSATAFAGQMMTVNGTITDDYLLVDDVGQIFVVTETDKGYELLENVGARVSVTGDVEESDDGPVIDVRSFKVIAE